MQLTTQRCWELLYASEHGVLSTSQGRGVDSVPVCFVLLRQADSERSVLASPIDRVKAKDTTELSRIKNLEGNPRAALLCENWDRDDWSRLWWVRARLLYLPAPDADGKVLGEAERALREKYRQYRDTDFARVLVFDVASIVGWSASETATSG